MLTEENCRDIEKMAKLLQVDSVVKCCVDFYECLKAKTGVNAGGPKMNFHDCADFKHIRTSAIHKTESDVGNKRPGSAHRPLSPGSKRQKVHDSSVVNFMGQDVDNRHNRGSRLDRDHRSGSRTGHDDVDIVEIVEDSLDFVYKDPAEHDSDGWPKDSNLPPVHRHQGLTVASKQNRSSELQIVNVYSDSERNNAHKFHPTSSSQSASPSNKKLDISQTSTSNNPIYMSQASSTWQSHDSNSSNQSSSPSSTLPKMPTLHPKPALSKPFASGSPFQTVHPPASSSSVFPGVHPATLEASFTSIRAPSGQGTADITRGRVTVPSGEPPPKDSQNVTQLLAADSSSTVARFVYCVH